MAAAKLCADKIRVNCVAPTAVATVRHTLIAMLWLPLPLFICMAALEECRCCLVSHGTVHVPVYAAAHDCQFLAARRTRSGQGGEKDVDADDVPHAPDHGLGNCDGGLTRCAARCCAGNMRTAA